MRMNKESIKEKVRAYVKQNFLLESELIDDKESFTQAGVVDSIGIIELVDFICREFNVDIPEELLSPDNLDSIESVTNLITKLLKNGNK